MYSSIEFQKNFSYLNNIKIDYYISPLLKNNDFIHAFFTKESSKIDINSQGEKLIRNNYNNCIIKQIHSNKLVLTSKLIPQKNFFADGLIGDEKNQNLLLFISIIKKK